jgi:hypothetical protein
MNPAIYKYLELEIRILRNAPRGAVSETASENKRKRKGKGTPV